MIPRRCSYADRLPLSEGQGSSFDWFLQPEYLLPLLEPYLLECGKGKDVRVLMLGCGNSLLGEVVRPVGLCEGECVSEADASEAR
jgi:predicted TPR repeat methyltransferase